MYTLPTNYFNKKIVFKKPLVDAFTKSFSDRKLEYFKKELLKILDNQKDEEEVSKSLAVYELYEEMAKGGRIGTVGEIRTWQGKKYKKMPNKKWVRVYDKTDKHAQTSIARLKGKVRKATTIDELFDIVMNNTHRFSDENGKPLDIVYELKKEVDAKKKKLNEGKASTQQKIEEFNARRKYAETQFEIGKNINDEELKNILSSVKHSQSRDEYINDYYLSRLDNYQEKILTDSNGYKGKITVSNDRKENQDETNAALFFQKKGCNVVMLSEKQRKVKERHPDLLVNGVLVEVKTCKESNANGIASEIKNAINKRNTEIPTVFLFDKSAKEEYKDIVSNLNKKKDYLVADVNAIMLIKDEVITLVDKKNTVGFQKEVPSANNNIPSKPDSVKEINPADFGVKPEVLERNNVKILNEKFDTMRGTFGIVERNGAYGWIKDGKLSIKQNQTYEQIKNKLQSMADELERVKQHTEQKNKEKEESVKDNKEMNKLLESVPLRARKTVWKLVKQINQKQYKSIGGRTSASHYTLQKTGENSYKLTITNLRTLEDKEYYFGDTVHKSYSARVDEIRKAFLEKYGFNVDYYYELGIHKEKSGKSYLYIPLAVKQPIMTD